MIGRDRGSAIVEFVLLGLLLLVPLVYILLAVLDVQRTAYGVTQAAREAGRVYSRTGDPLAARAAAQVALDDQQVTGPVAVHIRGAYAPGAEVTVEVATAVHLPFLPEPLADAVHAKIPVSATHAVTVDRYRDL